MTDQPVWEIAEIDVLPGTEEKFEAGVAEAQPLFLGAAGCHGVQLCRSVEYPTRYRLIVEWQTLEHHTVTFRGSVDFARWRELVGPYFANPPRVEHIYRVGERPL
jgi:heme-degrading monooxygenase HmoA